MKKIYLLLAVVIMCSCCTIMPDPDVHFVDEKFVLIEKTEKEMNINGNTKNVRTWKIQRNIVTGDSLEIGVINNKGCVYIINDELWYNKEVGDTLYFEYIRKDRFYKVENLDAVGVSEYDAIDFHDLMSLKFDAICFLNGYETLPNTDGKHHIMYALLLTNVKAKQKREKEKAIQELHQL